MLAKQQPCTCITLFCTFLSRRCTTATWNFQISRACFMEQVAPHKKFSFSFSKIKYGPFGFNPWKFRQHLTNEMKLNKMDSVETVRIHFYSEFSVCCHPEILLPWKRDVTTSPLYIGHLARIMIKFRWGEHFRKIFFQSWLAFFNPLNFFLRRSCHYWRIEFKAMMASCRSFKRWMIYSMEGKTLSSW